MTDSTVTQKLCPFCNEIKPKIDFHKNKAIEDGFNNKCKICVKAYHVANSEKIKARRLEWASENRERILAKRKSERMENREEINEKRRAYHAENRDKVNAAKRAKRACPEVKAKEREYMVKWRAENGALRKEHETKRYHTKRKFDLRFMLSKNIANQLRKSLNGKGGKNRRTWESLVGYTVDELEARLRKTMPDGYTWADYLSGELHVDHIIPVAAHNFTSSDDIDFKRCWALKNLRLLPKLENIRKKDKIDKPFQPSLTGL